MADVQLQPQTCTVAPVGPFYAKTSCDLLTSDDVISVLICISSVKFYRVFQYKHFEVWLVVLCFTVLKIMTISLSPTPKLSSGLSSERRTLWRHFWSYCRVTKGLPSLFCYATWSSSWKLCAHFFGTRGPPQRLDYCSMAELTTDVRPQYVPDHFQNSNNSYLVHDHSIS